MERIRYDNLTKDEVYELYGSKEKEFNYNNIQEMLLEIKEKLNIDGKVDINYMEKYKLILKKSNEISQKISEHYLNNSNGDELEIQELYEKVLVRRAREKYPDLMRKYQNSFNERRDYIYEENTTLEFPIEVIFEMIEEENLDIDVWKEFGYPFEGMKFAEKIINEYYEKLK